MSLDFGNYFYQNHNIIIFSNICLQDRKVFLQEQKLYQQKKLKEHLIYGDNDTKIKHELCQFCSIYFFDIDKLYEHLMKQHESCFLCIKNGILYQYYKNYSTLVIKKIKIIF